jgi:hypothetical protein
LKDGAGEGDEDEVDALGFGQKAKGRMWKINDSLIMLLTDVAECFLSKDFSLLQQVFVIMNNILNFAVLFFFFYFCKILFSLQFPGLLLMPL